MITYECGHSYHKVCPENSKKLIKKPYKIVHSSEEERENERFEEKNEEKCTKCEY